MKKLIAVFLMCCAGFAMGADHPAAGQGTGDVVKGEVMEAQDAGNYTYLRLKTKDGETWAAVGKATVRKGDTVTVENAMLMSNFESKTLKRTFDKIVFGNLAGAGNGVAAAHAGTAVADIGDVKVPKAAGADARTVAEITGGRAGLKDKKVTVRGKVVKYNPEIMGKNWVHLRDGSGSAQDGTDDLLVTTSDATKVGDVVVAKGVVRTDKDFGSGYAYKVLVEDAKLSK